MAEKNRMEFYRLEDRVLFEAGAVVQAAEAAAAKNAAAEDSSAAAETPSEMTESENGFDMTADDLAELTLPADPVKLDYAASEAAQTPAADVPVVFNTAGEGAKLTISTPRELVVINTSVADTDSILASLNTNQEVLFLESGKDAMAQINDYLDENGGTKYSAIHFVTHGGEGFFTMAGEIIRAENTDTAAWAEVGEHLTDGADLMFYGCDLAANEQGEALCGKIAGAAGADVAASTDTTGISGNWNLEFAAGTIETDSISVENYAYDLATFTVTNTNTSGEGSLAQAVADLSNSSDSSNTITIQKGLGTIYTEGTLTISKAVTIEGNGVIIDGGNKIANGVSNDAGHRIFNITAKTTIDGVTFQNAYSATTSSNGHGAAINASAAVTISNSKFVNNVAGGGGGAIFFNPAANSGSLTITDTVFEENQAESSSHGGGAIFTNNSNAVNLSDVTFTENTGGRGGAIYAKNGTFVLENTTFENNSASGTNGGGAIVFGENGGGTLTLSGKNVFSDNFASSGGAINIKGSTNTLIIQEEGTEFTGNTATSNGGAIYITGGTSTITGAEFTQNSVSAENARGGALYIANGTNTFTDTVFTENSITDTSTGNFGGSVSYGGAVCISGGTNMFTDSVFEGNSAKVPSDVDGRSHGGAVGIIGGTVNTFKSVTFRENTATQGGAVLVSTEAPLYITDSIFEQNKATASAGLTGGGSALATINHGTTNISIERSSFTGNEDGGAALLFNAGNIIIADSTIAGNTGKGILARKSNNPLTITLVHSAVAGNTDVSVDSGSETTINLLNSIVVGNADGSASGLGGAGTFNIYSSIYESTASGSVTEHTQTGSSEVADYTAVFGTNTPGVNGGNQKTLVPVETISTTMSVGPVTYHRNAETGVLEGVTAASGFLLGSDAAAGEVRSMDGRSLPIRSGIAAHVVGAVDPGIYVAWSGSKDADAEGNTYYSTLQAAVDAGGTIYLVAGNIAEGKTVTVSKDVTLIGQGADKTSIDGGSGYSNAPDTAPTSGVQIMKITEGTVTIDDVTFQNGYNTANSQAGAIYVSGNASLNMTDSALRYNYMGTSGNNGALLFNSKGSLTITDSAFENNHSGNQHGGASSLCVASSTNATVQILNTEFIDTASLKGSSLVRIYSDTTTLFDNCNFESSVKGTFIYEGANLTVSNSVFDGSFSINKGSNYIGGCEFSGGLINGGTATITDSVFTGALNVKGDTTLKLRDTAFTGASLITNLSHSTGSHTVITAERCIFTNKNGSSVQINSNRDGLTTTAVFADCTFTGNKNGIEFTSSKDIAANITLIHCTVAGNTEAAIKNSSAYANTVNIINSIVVGDNKSGAGLTDAKGTLTYNVYNSVYEKADDVTLAADTGNISTMTYENVFGTNELGDNGGYMESLKPVDTFAVTGPAVTYYRDANGNLTGVKYNNASYGTTENMTESARSTDGRGMPLIPTATAFTVGSMELNNFYVAWSGSADASAAGNVYYSTMQDAADAADAGGTIYLIDQTIQIEGTITVEKDVVIKGQGTDKSVLDGMGLYSIMNIASGATVSIDGVAFLNGYTADAKTGGAITAAGTLTITNSLFKGNNAVNGGAVYAVKASQNEIAVSIKSTVFEGNNATTNGGAIYIEKGTLNLDLSDDPATVTKSVFADNSGTNGGALAFGSSTTINAYNTVFTNNSASAGGGAVYRSGNNIGVNFTNCSFTGNSAGGNGGALLLQALNADGCIFDGNHAAKGGGAIHYSTTVEGRFVVQNSTLVNNTATNGGVIGCESAVSAMIVNSTIAGNKATTSGGVAYNSVILVSCTLTGNEAGTSGALVCTDNVARNYVFSMLNTIAVDNVSGDGNDIYVTASESEDNTRTVQIINSIYGGTIAESAEGAIKTTTIDTFSAENAGKWTAADLFSGTETTASGQLVYNLKGDAVAAWSGVYIYHSSDWTTVAYSAAKGGDKTLFLGTDVSKAATPVETDLAGKTITLAAIGTTVLDATPGLTVDTADDTINLTDGKTSFREVLMYIEKGLVSATDGVYTVAIDSAVTAITLGSGLPVVDGVSVAGDSTSVTYTGDSIYAGTYGDLTVENSASLAGNVTVLGDFVLKGAANNILTLTGNSNTLTVNDSGTASAASQNIQFADLSGVNFVNSASGGDGKVYLDSGNELKDKTSGAMIVILASEVTVSGTSLTYGQALSEAAAASTTAVITTKRGTKVDATYSFVNGSAVPTANGSYAVTVSVSGADYYVMPTSLTADVTVGQAVLTVTFNEDAFTKIYDGSTAFDWGGSAYTLIGQQNGDELSLSFVAVFDKATVDAATVTMSNFVLGGTNAGNYTLSFTNGIKLENGSVQIAGKISPKDLTVTISDSTGNLTNSGTIEYGTEVSLTGSYDEKELAIGDALSFNITTDKGLNSTGKYYNAGEHAVSHGVKIMDGETDVTDSYKITFEGLKNFTVNQKALTGFTADKVYDKTATLAGTTFYLDEKIVDGDTVSASMGDQTLSGINAGTYTVGKDQVILSGADAENYTVTEDVAVTVGKREIHISSISGTYGGTVTEYATDNVTGSALVDGDTISGLLTTDLGALNGNYVAGTHTVAGFSELAINDGNGGANYQITNDLTTFTVDRRKVTVGFTEPLTKTYDGTDVYTLTGSEYDLENVLSSDSLTLAVDSAAYSTILAGGADTQVTFSGMKLEGSASENYILVDDEDNELTAMDVAGRIDKLAMTVWVDDHYLNVSDGGSAVYGTEIEFGVFLTGMAETDIGTFNVTTDPGFSAGNLYYAAGEHTVDAGIVIRNGETDVTGCYDITYEGVRNFTVTKREITVTADDASKYEGDPDPVFTYTVTGDAAEGETIGVTVQRVFGALVPAVQVSYGNYDVTANYSITAITGTLTIQEKPVIPGGGSEGGTVPGGGSESGVIPVGDGRYVDATISNTGTTSVLYTVTAQPVDGLPVSSGNPSTTWQDVRSAGRLLGADSNGVIFDREFMRQENGVIVQDPYLYLPQKGVAMIDFTENERYPSTAEIQVDLGESYKMKSIVVYASFDYTFGHRDLNQIGDDVDELRFDGEYKSGHKRSRSSFVFDLGVTDFFYYLFSDAGTRNLTVNGEEKSFAGLEIRQAEGTLPSVAFGAAAAEDETAGLELAGDPLQLHRASACQDEFDELLEAFLAV